MEELTLMQLAIFMRSRDYAEKTIAMYSATNRPWRIDPASIDRAAIRDWVWGADKQSKRRHRWLAMRRLVECLQDVEILDPGQDYTAGVKMPQEALKVQPSVDDDVVARLMAACEGTRFIDKRDRALLFTLASTGMRSGELMALELSDLDNSSTRALFVYLRVRQQRASGEQALWITQRGRPAGVELVGDVLD